MLSSVQSYDITNVYVVHNVDVGDIDDIAYIDISLILMLNHVQLCSIILIILVNTYVL